MAKKSHLARVALALAGASASAMVPASAQGHESRRSDASNDATATSSAVALLSSTATAGDGQEIGGRRLASAATKAVAPCDYGPGRMAVTVYPLTAEGTYPVKVSARGLADDSRWRGRVQWEEAGQVQDFRRTAVEGRWSLTTHMPESEGDQPDMVVSASGVKGGSCWVGVIPGPVPVAYAACRNGLDALGVLARKDGTYAVFTAVLGVAPQKTKWRVRVAVRGEDDGQSVTFTDYSNRYAELLNAVTFTDLPANPRFAFHAKSRENRAECRLRLNPAPITASSSKGAGPSGLRLLPRGLDSRP